MFGRKKKNLLFGAQIEPECRYCRHNGSRDGQEPVCVLHREPKGKACKKYEYDPLRREPRNAPPIHTEQYSEDDFKL